MEINTMSALEVMKMANLAIDRYNEGEELSEIDYQILGISRRIIIHRNLDNFCDY